MAISDKDFKAYAERAHFTAEEIELAQKAINLLNQGDTLMREQEVLLSRLFSHRSKNVEQLKTELSTTRDLIEVEKQRFAHADGHAQILAQNRKLISKDWSKQVSP